MAPGERDSAGQARTRPASLHTPSLMPCPPSPSALAQATGTHRVLRLLRPRNMRPCTVSSWLPVSISSCTPAAPSKAPSLTSLILLLLRFLEEGTEWVRTDAEKGPPALQPAGDPPGHPWKTGCWGA